MIAELLSLLMIAAGSGLVVAPPVHRIRERNAEHSAPPSWSAPDPVLAIRPDVPDPFDELDRGVIQLDQVYREAGE